MSYERVEAWLLKPWNAAFCLWTMIWGAILLTGAIDYFLWPWHSHQEWLGWLWTSIIAGLPLNLLLLPLLEYIATHSTAATPLESFLITWTVNAAGSFVFWLVLVPFVYKLLTGKRSLRSARSE